MRVGYGREVVTEKGSVFKVCSGEWSGSVLAIDEASKAEDGLLW